MIKSLRKAYGAGFRAGISEPEIITLLNGRRVIASPENPYKHFWQCAHSLCWHAGRMDGMMKRLA